MKKEAKGIWIPSCWQWGATDDLSRGLLEKSVWCRTEGELERLRLLGVCWGDSQILCSYMWARMLFQSG